MHSPGQQPGDMDTSSSQFEHVSPWTLCKDDQVLQQEAPGERRRPVDGWPLGPVLRENVLRDIARTAQPKEGSGQPWRAGLPDSTGSNFDNQQRIQGSIPTNPC
ncbi:hypothetical protein MAPG_00448 [Magnaporthiopsis poae ATCC 64411]|uniref:Uncharacterized protein n=1 Tax=Magnaporthiopsis poae (strain ATCC 64411 / 73-15) TaxID=644358 RepID=A0A0C4DL14_MAGP6|nr:hypothetical protein MAPG_00448 [Magnaporthiopsis poae ATCC 64411]